MKKIHYFSYGSNIKQQRLEERVGKVTYIGNYTLQNYKLEFNCESGYGDTYANIVQSQGDTVEGCLYELTPIQLAKLDRYELLYYKEFFDLPNGILGVTYVSLPFAVSNRPQKPWLNYINIILEGCLEKNLNSTYNKVLEYKEANYKLKKGSKFKRR